MTLRQKMYHVFRGPHHGPRLPHFPKTKGELKIKDFISNYGTKKYLKISDDNISLDEEKIISDASWDGIYGVISGLGPLYNH